MANSLGTRPIVIDTASANVLLTEWLKLESFTFTDYSVDIDAFVIQDKNGLEIAAGNGKSDLSPVHETSISWIHGLKVPTLAAGAKLMLYVK